ncbi:hypothetical protein HanIR_Chr09g0406051 [Helianthus annuus]|nr:hypothetical protein HanIR_Chr09g0406051 [Helianthus annuus]
MVSLVKNNGVARIFPIILCICYTKFNGVGRHRCSKCGSATGFAARPLNRIKSKSKNNESCTHVTAC